MKQSTAICRPLPVLPEPVSDAPEGPIRLSEVTRELLAASLAPHTRASYAGALDALDRWLVERRLDLCDASLAEYFSEMYAHGRAPATAKLAVAAIRFRTKVGARDNPIGPLTERVLVGFFRSARDRGRGQVSGLRWEQADAAAALAEAGGGLIDLRDAALIALASDALLRVGEVAQLTMRDLLPEPDGTGRVRLRFSKTDQKGRGATQFLGPTTMRRLRAWLEASRIQRGPIFRRIRRGGHLGREPLSTQAIRCVIRSRSRAAGVEGRISGHSPRVGAAQSLLTAGATLVDLQRAGRWSSTDMPGHYCQGQLAAQGAVARLRYGL